MISSLPQHFVAYLQTLPPEVVSIGMFLASVVMVLSFYRLFGVIGLYVYTAVAVIAANIQVLKAVQFSFIPEPVALGTILFASTFLAMDIITEKHGKAAAIRGVWIGLSATLCMTVVMLFTMGWQPLGPGMIHSHANFIKAHEAIMMLFMPLPAIFLASLISYVISEYTDIYIFDWFHRKMAYRFLGLRAAISSCVGTILDTVIFSTLAWVVFAATPISTATLIHTYIIGTLVFRLMVAVANAPVMYIARRIEV
jgi:hypothetical protein